VNKSHNMYYVVYIPLDRQTLPIAYNCSQLMMLDLWHHKLMTVSIITSVSTKHKSSQIKWPDMICIMRWGITIGVVK